MFPHLTADDWHNMAANYPDAIGHMHRINNLREMDYLRRACRGKLATPWEHDRLRELENSLGNQ